MNASSSLENLDKAFVMFYNVENLFPPDPVARNKFDPRISGLPNWNKERFETKLKKLASVFELVQSECGQMPLFVGLSEVQGKEPLKALLQYEPFTDSFDYILYESLDERGVDVALLYDRSQVEVLESRPMVYFFEIPDKDPENYDTTRDILYCKIKYKEQIVNVYVVHLPSKREDEINAPKREFILTDLAKAMESHRLEGESVLVMGDFNEDPTSQMIDHLRFEKGGEEVMKNPFLELYQSGNYSTFHQKQGLLFDQILLSTSFFGASRQKLKFSRASVFNHAKISNWDRKFSGRPYRTYAGRRYLGGYSDHFPVLVEFNVS
ncbi:endonuclease/exonuclease/phosphatase family protein [Chryseobacterium sp. A301]